MPIIQSVTEEADGIQITDAEFRCHEVDGEMTLSGRYRFTKTVDGVKQFCTLIPMRTFEIKTLMQDIQLPENATLAQSTEIMFQYITTKIMADLQG